MNLFQKHRFKMHSGGFSDFKLECDALTPKDWDALAFIASRGLTFKQAFGIPRGGLKFAKALNQYATPSSNTILIADDVLTTGGSIKEFQAKLISQGYKLENMQNLVVFARGELTPNTIAMFTLNQNFWQND